MLRYEAGDAAAVESIFAKDLQVRSFPHPKLPCTGPNSCRH
ncbi:hypothetical protein VQ056_03365 [Paenibacillus sp. JTLBN-2024]